MNIDIRLTDPRLPGRIDIVVTVHRAPDSASSPLPGRLAVSITTDNGSLCAYPTASEARALAAALNCAATELDAVTADDEAAFQRAGEGYTARSRT
ncbi:hypothetical protein [Rhizobacter sp. Root1221]|uniref:hypothetical protein n=1 Tax=Rhizobacter sp. Root1221 TaxID=1736433 RepID=UPI0006F53B92|nr:hypothetical protein [Rhizobacter sp. Root1221]KQV85455.1 hypothetical protein ASC87_07125 [Rhizobacter sp. Root1221]